MKSAVILGVLALLPVSTATSASADPGVDHVNAIRVSNRALSGRTACIEIENAYFDKYGQGSSSHKECKKIGVRKTYTWYFGYFDQHPAISVVVKGDGRSNPYTFKADAVARDLCFRFSGSGSFHEANDCSI